MVDFLSQLNTETEVLLTLSIILFSGFILTRMTNTLNMPKVSGYILAGILIGPCCLNFIPAPMIEGMGFVSDLALAFIAFGVGKFFKKEVLMRTGKRIIVITLSEALTAGVLVTVVLKLVFRLNWEFALILGAIATATAPASTMMTINQYKARGEFVDTLLQIVALDDVVCLLAFSIVSAIINGNEAGGFSAHDILLPIAYNLLVIVLGIFCGYFLSRLLIPARSKDNRLILAIAMLLGLSGICAAIDISPLLSCMVFGAVYINLTRDKKLFRQINSFTPPVMSIFFIVSGMNLDIGALRTVGAIGVGYFIVRIIGKYMGTYISCMCMKTSREIRNFMGLALIPQAGVAIGLAFLGQRMLPPETGSMMLTIILSSSVLYEMAGPVSAKAALLLSGSIPYGKKENQEAGVETSGDMAEEPAERSAAGTAGEAGEETPADMAEEPPEESAVAIEGEDTERVRTSGTETDAASDSEEGLPADSERPDSEAAEGAEKEGKEKTSGNRKREESRKKAKHRKESGSRGKAKKDAAKKREKVKESQETGPAPHSEEAEEKRSFGRETVQQRPKGITAEPEIPEEEEELHAVLPELREYSKEAEEGDVYDIERELKPPKPGKKKKGKKSVSGTKERKGTEVH
nr:cation:proton antiporter [uncultured Acetatifactor sp.]